MAADSRRSHTDRVAGRHPGLCFWSCQNVCAEYDERGNWHERTGKREGNFKILSQGATKQQKGRKEIAKKGARETSDNKSNIIGKLEVLKRIYKRYTSQHT
ncbi:hypothetical protein DEO72_LG11g949 [Vigna unguiculata]|uniref:Uncharacterized protein n=1 Tax=Vigna unguiculata TaxID=3917 RepID=A0A4D6NLZ2_VIGUN|nr:hypothetical protein DEO72_LG11g949 [Vigna unguiculata]